MPRKTRASKKTESSEEEEIYEVEHIVGRRINDGVEEFFVKWKSYAFCENTWEPLANLNSCDNAIANFRKGPFARRSEPLKPIQD